MALLMTRPARRAPGISVHGLLAAFAAVVLLPMLIFAAAILMREAQAAARLTSGRAAEVATRTATLLDYRLGAVQAALDSLGGSRFVDSGELSQLQQRATEVEVLAGRQVTFTRGGSDVAGVIGIPVTVPVNRGSERIGTLSVTIPGSEISQVLASQAPTRDWTLSVVDRSGRIVARSADFQRFAGTLATADLRRNASGDQGTWQGSTADGRQVSAAYQRLERSGFIVAAGVPTSVIAEPMNRARTSLVWMGLLSLLVSVGLGGVVGSWIARPLRQLASSSGELSAAPRLSGGTRVREVAELELALSTAASRAREHEIEQKAELRRRADVERRLRLVVNELNHRVKNTLAVVQSVAVRTFNRDAGPEAARKFSERLQALARAHDLLTARAWEGAELHDIVWRSLEGLGIAEGRIAAHGPTVMLASERAVSLSMVLHELGTNAIKYGALSNEQGRIALDWSLESEKLELTWAEHGGPPVRQPARSGFGTELIRRTLGHGGSVSVDFRPNGLVASLSLALEREAATELHAYADDLRSPNSV